MKKHIGNIVYLPRCNESLLVDVLGQDVIKRVLASVRQVLQGEIGESVLLVCHSWVNKTLIASVTPGLGLHKLLDVPQRNCAVNVLDYSCGENGEGEFKVLAVDLVAGARAARI